ncbi:hypothetical protein [Gilvibacter sediminis]|uniref:hypothetical protein n=1 Tax=Gilvibacter sediminis TaxID=379071 RepID=UPI002350DE58|nr:hypothetical protein [Gilvibacter sediminis]
MKRVIFIIAIIAFTCKGFAQQVELGGKWVQMSQTREIDGFLTTINVSELETELGCRSFLIFKSNYLTVGNCDYEVFVNENFKEKWFQTETNYSFTVKDSVIKFDDKQLVFRFITNNKLELVFNNNGYIVKDEYLRMND